MYQSWSKSDPSADAIIKLIEERERKEVNNSRYENESANWNIVRYREPGEKRGRDGPKRDEEHDSFASQWRGDREQFDPRARESWERNHTEVVPMRSHAEVVPARSSSLSKQLKTEIDVEWRVRKRSNSPNERVDSRSRRHHMSSENLQYEQMVQSRIRSRSRSVDRKREQRRSRSRSSSRAMQLVRSERRHSRSRSSSRDGKRKKSNSIDRSNSRDHKRQRNSSMEKRADRSDRQRSRSRDFERRRRSPTPKRIAQIAENPTAIAETSDILSKFVSLLKEVKEQPAQIVPNSNVLPEFDSSNNGHTIRSWLLRVEDVAKLFGWGDKETIQFALPKLVGEAKTWYQTLETVPYSWSDWRKVLMEQFKCPNFGRLLAEMAKKHAVVTESLEQYYFAKMVLVNRCGFKGRYAVDCVLSGIQIESIRLCAEAADIADPEELLKYLKSIEPLWLDNRKTKAEKYAADIKKACFYCGKAGHKPTACRLKPNKLLKKNRAQLQKTKLKIPYLPPQFDQFRPPQQFQPKPFHPSQQFQPVQQFQPEQQFQPPAFHETTNNKKRFCFNCRKRGHIAEDCSSPKSDLPNTRALGNEPTPPGVEGEDD